MVLRIVNCELTKGVSIHEHFVGFLVAEDTTGKGLLNLFLGDLETLNLDLCDSRGQSYDTATICKVKGRGSRSIKTLSTTRWECQVDAMKAVRYQLPEIVDALVALKEHAKEKKDPECVSSADSIIEDMMKWPFNGEYHCLVQCVVPH